MPRNKLRGDALPVAQVREFTITNAADGDAISVTINGKTVSYEPDGDTEIEAAEFLVTALGAATAKEFTAIEWSEDGAAKVIGTAATPGKPFTFTAAAAGSSTVSDAGTDSVDSSGPNHWDDPTNWTAGTIPATGEDVDLQDCATDLLYGIDQNAVTLASLNIHSTYTGKIGLQPQNGDYYEYLNTDLKIGATLVTIGAGTGSGSSRIRLNTGSVQTTILVLATSTAGQTGQPAVFWKGTHASNQVTVNSGSFGAGFNLGDAATVLNLRGGNAGVATAESRLYVGAGVTLGTLTTVGGRVYTLCGMTTASMDGGELTLAGDGPCNITTLTVRSGLVNVDSPTTIGTSVFGSGAVLDLSRDPRTSKTFTNITMNAGSGIKDPAKRGTFTNGIVFNCEIDAVNPHELGDLITLTRS